MWPSRLGGADRAGVGGGGFEGFRSVCGRRRGVSFGSFCDKSGGFDGICESASGAAEGIARGRLRLDVSAIVEVEKQT